MFFFGDDRFADLKVKDGRVYVHQPLKILLNGGNGMPNYFIVELDVEVSIPDPGTIADPTAPTLPWEVVKIRVTRAAPAEKTGPGTP